MSLTRRRFLRAGAAASAGLFVPGALDALARSMAAAHPDARTTQTLASGYGPLVPDPAGLLDLPAGFQYQTLSCAVLGTENDPRFSHRLTTGEMVPALHDGMALFEGLSGISVLVRNHEMEPGLFPAVDPRRRRPYDPLGTGGTTTLWVDAERRVVRSFPSLSGTFRNCAGGATPWGSWLTAEECTYMPGPFDPVVFDRRPDVQRRHGYVFEVDARAEGLVDPVPIVGMGRFYHEAIAVDPNTGFVYLTEDRDDGLLYRYRPAVITNGSKDPDELRPGDLARGGILEALRIVQRPGAKTQNWTRMDFAPGRYWAIDWVRIPVVDPDVDMERDPSHLEIEPLRRRPRTAATSTRAQGFREGAAQFARNEGIAYHRRAIYFCATNGGPLKAGQVWRLDLAGRMLALMLQPDDRALLSGPDNLIPAPNGDLIVCEDTRTENFVVGITPRGRIYRLARNAINPSEFAGACFSPDGQTMFVNIQEPGITFAIWGPWENRRA